MKQFLPILLILGTTILWGCKDRPSTESSSVGKGTSDAPASVSDLEKEESKSSNSKLLSQLKFNDSTQETGIDFTIRIGYEAGFYSYLEMLGGGCGATDFDRDGLMDLAIAGGGLLNKDETLPECQAHSIGLWVA